MFLQLVKLTHSNMNLFDSILEKAKQTYTGSSFYKGMESVWSKAYDWANTPTQNEDVIQKFLDDSAIDTTKKRSLLQALNAGEDETSVRTYLTEKYYPQVQPQFHETLPMAQPLFPSTGQEGVIGGTAKMIGNAPTSLYNLVAWGVNIGSTAMQEWAWPTAEMLGKWIVRGIWQWAESVSQAYQQQGLPWAISTALQGTQKAIVNDPALLFAPQMIKGAWVATKAGGKAIVKWAEVVAPKVTNAIVKTPQKIWQWLTTWTEYSTSLATGLSREAQQTIKSSPALYKEARLWNITAQGELANFVKATETRLNDLSELWKGYESIKAWNKVASVDDITNAYVKATEWVRDTQLTKADRLVLKDANDYMSQLKWELDETDLLWLRRQLDSIMYDPNTGLKRKISPTGERIVNSMRAEIDKIAKERIPWLKELDAQYWPEVALLKDVKKQIYDANGNIKPTALSTISNIVGKNKDFKLEQFQKIYPELGARIKALKAFEEVQSLGEIKTGSVIRQGGAIAAGSAVAPWFWTIVWWMATNPYVVARILEAYGIAKAKIQSIISKWSKITPQEAALVAKAVAETPKSKVEDIINNLSYDAKADKLTSWTIWPTKFNTLWQKKKVITPQSPVAWERGYTTAIKKPIVKRASDASMETKLIEEARKYKSAEEFIKAQGEPVYHWTNKNFEEFKVWLDSERWLLWSTYKVKTNWIFFTDDAKTASEYWKNVIKSYVKPNNTLIPRDIKTATDFYKKVDTEPLWEILTKISKSKNWDKFDRYIDLWNEKIEFELLRDGTMALDDIYRFSEGWLDWRLLDNPDFIKWMKDKWFDSTYVYEPNDTTMKSLFVLDTSKIKTEAQLKQLYEQSKK